MIEDRRLEIQIEEMLGRVEDLENKTDKHQADINIINNENIVSVSAAMMGKLVLFDNNFVKLSFYDPDSVGFDKALLAANDGDIILIPPCTIDDDHTMIAGVKVVGRSRFATILTGQITGAAGASIENLSITRAANSADDLIGVDSPASGTFWINDCNISVIQAGAGDAYALSVDVSGSVMKVYSSDLYGSSGSGSGYAAYHSDGSCYVDSGWSYGSTATYNV